MHLFSRALHVLDASQQIEIKSLSCEETITWDHGYSLINYMKNVSNKKLSMIDYSDFIIYITVVMLYFTLKTVIYPLLR